MQLYSRGQLGLTTNKQHCKRLTQSTGLDHNMAVIMSPAHTLKWLTGVADIPEWLTYQSCCMTIFPVMSSRYSFYTCP